VLCDTNYVSETGYATSNATEMIPCKLCPAGKTGRGVGPLPQDQYPSTCGNNKFKPRSSGPV
jgi:hypothetical protein